MTKSIKYLLLLVACCFFVSCQQSLDKNADEVPQSDNTAGKNGEDEIDIFDFKNIEKAPESTESQSIDNVIKVFFDETSIDEPYSAVAIDIKNNELYKNPIISRRGLRAQEGVVEVSNTDGIYNILEKYDVQSWEEDYTFEDPKAYEDGYSWRLWLQFEDGTVEKHGGKGTDVEKLTPDNFAAFADELRQYNNELINENE